MISLQELKHGALGQLPLPDLPGKSEPCRP